MAQRDRPIARRGVSIAASDDRRRALELVPVSRETEARFALYADNLRRWQGIKNLVAPSTLDHIWTRHIADCAQIAQYAPPQSRAWADLGSGAGFPGLVIGIMLTESGAGPVHLIESNARKCAFLRDTARATSAAVVVHHGRVEDVVPTLKDVDVLTSRALAPLSVLLDMGNLLLRRGATALFLKSEDEVTDYTARGPTAGLTIERSVTSAKGRIVVVRQGPHRDAAP